MKNIVAVLEQFGKFTMVEREMPVAKPDEVLIRVEYVGICGSNLHMFQHGANVMPKDPNQKLVLGHECAGEVVETGAQVRGIRVGDKVLIEPGVPCGKCGYCLSGRYNLCPDVNFIDVQPNYYGAMRTYLAFPADKTYVLPQGMRTLEGALVEPAAVGMHAATLAGVGPGKRIVILGTGCIGLMTLQACRVMGASEIVAVDIAQSRLELAKKLGASAVVNSGKTDAETAIKALFCGDGADIVFETAGVKATAALTTQLVARGGKIMLVGTVVGETPINFLRINREVSIQTVFRYANNFPATMEAIASGKFDVASMVTRVYDFSESQRAFEETIADREHAIKSVIRIGR